MKEAKLEGDALAKAPKQRTAGGDGFLAGVRMWPSRSGDFLEEVRTESKRVTWPTFTQVRSTTLVVILTVFFFGVYFGILDWVFNNVVRRILKLGS
jgi:preprotein translocase subunit SecE